MAKRTSESFAKRQKELARKEKAQRKAEKKMERKRDGGTSSEPELALGPFPNEEASAPGDDADEAPAEA
jgi:hypothetical protein